MKGWLRYWICDSSGSGREKWEYLYMPGIGDKTEAREHILHDRESWALHASSFSMNIELDVVPPKEEVFILIEHFETLAKDYGNMAADLRKEYGISNENGA